MAAVLPHLSTLKPLSATPAAPLQSSPTSLLVILVAFTVIAPLLMQPVSASATFAMPAAPSISTLRLGAVAV